MEETLELNLARELQKLIEKRLALPTSTISEKDIVVTAEDRRILENLLKKNLNTSGDLVKAVTHIVVFGIGGVQVQMPPRLLDRLESRCIGMNFEDFLRLTIIRQLEEYAGLR
jgi:hypothetical protein